MLLGLTLLLLVAAVVPICSLSPTTAMASDSDESHGDCGSSEEHGSVCHHQDQARARITPIQNVADTEIAQLAAILTLRLPADILPTAVSIDHARVAPTERLVPLRI